MYATLTLRLDVPSRSGVINVVGVVRVARRVFLKVGGGGDRITQLRQLPRTRIFGLYSDHFAFPATNVAVRERSDQTD